MATTVEPAARTKRAGVPRSATDSLDAFAADIETLRLVHSNDTSLADAVALRLRRLLANPAWLPLPYRVPADDGYRSHVVHVAPDGGWSLGSLVWKPGQRTPIHDHVCWCVVGVYQGAEAETRYHLHEGDDGRFLVEVERQVATAGDTVALVPPAEDIHAVENAGTGIAISLHVYGADIGRLGSSINHRFDDLPIRAAAGSASPIPWRQTAST
jgi:predicted metal-dependent enzyme (double-stranded beta helix superfamily)